MGEKNLRDSLVILPPQGRSCISSIKDIELTVLVYKRHQIPEIFFPVILVFSGIIQRIEVQDNDTTCRG